jgi:hypothetical protein
MLNKPKHQPQLGRGTAVPGGTRGSYDCGPRAVQVGIDYLTQGALVPAIDEIRRRMQKPGPKTTSTYDAERCVDSYDSEMKRYKRASLRYERVTGSKYLPRIEDAIGRGDYVHFAINYGKFNDLMRRRTGDPDYRKGHSVGVLGMRYRKGSGIQYLLWDSLDDHRNPSIPQGPRWVPKAAVIGAWKAFGYYAGIMRGGERLVA